MAGVVWGRTGGVRRAEVLLRSRWDGVGRVGRGGPGLKKLGRVGQSRGGWEDLGVGGGQGRVMDGGMHGQFQCRGEGGLRGQEDGECG
jgi:hypothetical protein